MICTLLEGGSESTRECVEGTDEEERHVTRYNTEDNWYTINDVSLTLSIINEVGLPFSAINVGLVYNVGMVGRIGFKF